MDAIHLRKVKTDKFTDDTEYTFFGTVKKTCHTIYRKGDIVEVGLSKEEFLMLKRLGKKANIVLVTIEGHNHEEYWNLKEFSKWTVEQVSFTKKVITYKGS